MGFTVFTVNDGLCPSTLTSSKEKKNFSVDIRERAVAHQAATGRVFAELAPSERFPACYFGH